MLVDPVDLCNLHLTDHSGPLLLGYTRDDGKEAGDDQGRPVDWHSLPLHRDEHQVRLDVDRSFIYYPDSTRTHGLSARVLPG